MTTNGYENFEFNGKRFNSDPDLVEFLSNAGWGPGNVARHAKALNRSGITNVAPLLTMSKNDLVEIRGITYPTAHQIYKHAQLIKYKGDILMDFERLMLSHNFSYLTSGSTTFDEIFLHPSGMLGWRSSLVVELGGQAGFGKTQIMSFFPIPCP